MTRFPEDVFLHGPSRRFGRFGLGSGLQVHPGEYFVGVSWHWIAWERGEGAVNPDAPPVRKLEICIRIPTLALFLSFRWQGQSEVEP